MSYRSNSRNTERGRLFNIDSMYSIVSNIKGVFCLQCHLPMPDGTAIGMAYSSKTGRGYHFTLCCNEACLDRYFMYTDKPLYCFNCTDALITRPEGQSNLPSGRPVACSIPKNGAGMTIRFYCCSEGCLTGLAAWPAFGGKMPVLNIQRATKKQSDAADVIGYAPSSVTRSEAAGSAPTAASQVASTSRPVAHSSNGWQVADGKRSGRGARVREDCAIHPAPHAWKPQTSHGNGRQKMSASAHSVMRAAASAGTIPLPTTSFDPPVASEQKQRGGSTFQARSAGQGGRGSAPQNGKRMQRPARSARVSPPEATVMLRNAPAYPLPTPPETPYDIVPTDVCIPDDEVEVQPVEKDAAEVIFINRSVNYAMSHPGASCQDCGYQIVAPCLTCSRVLCYDHMQEHELTH